MIRRLMAPLTFVFSTGISVAESLMLVQSSSRSQPIAAQPFDGTKRSLFARVAEETLFPLAFMVLVFVQTSCCGYHAARRGAPPKEDVPLEQLDDETERLLHEEEETIEEVVSDAATAVATAAETAAVTEAETASVSVTKCGGNYHDVTVSDSARALRDLQAEQKAKRNSQIVTVHEWKDEGDFELFLYLKLDELIRDGKAGFNAIKCQDEEEERIRLGKDKSKNATAFDSEDLAYESETSEVAPAYSETAPAAEQLPDYPPPEYCALPEVSVEKALKAPLDDDENANSEINDDEDEGYEPSLSDDSLGTPEEATPVTSDDEEDVARVTGTPPSTPTKPTQLEKESEVLNDKILSMIQDATRALDTHWADYLEEDHDFEDDIDDIGADLDYLALLNSVSSPTAEITEFDEEPQKDGSVRTMFRSSLTRIRSFLGGSSE